MRKKYLTPICSVILIIIVLFICQLLDREEKETPALPSDKETAGMMSANEDYLFMRREKPNPFDRYEKMPDGEAVKIKIKNIGGPLPGVFNDSNVYHLEVAVNKGIKPLTNTADAWRNTAGIVPVESDPYLCVDSLTHSVPYLKSYANDALQEISRAFLDSLQARGGGEYRIIVTSVLRTPETVRRLKRRNRNASENSAHVFGTTFDISYRRFAYSGKGIVRTQEDLKNLLGEVLNDQRNLGRIYVKYERKQSCFHITAR